MNKDAILKHLFLSFKFRKNKKMSSNKAILTYFAGRGRAEIIRLTMVATGVQVNFNSLSESIPIILLLFFIN